MRSFLSDAEQAEEVRAAAVCGEGPNHKLFQAEIGAEQGDFARKARRENPEAKTERDAEADKSRPGPIREDGPSRSVFACDDPESAWIVEQERLAAEEDDRLAAEEETAREARMDNDPSEPHPWNHDTWAEHWGER